MRGNPDGLRALRSMTKGKYPAAIVAHNLHGIDIDLRAVQLSALTLYLKAKTLNPKATLRESRLACADIHMLDGNRLQEFLTQAGLQERPIYGRILTALQNRLKDAEQLGSLLRLDEEIRALVEQERQRYERQGRQLDFPGWSQEQFETEAGRREFWEILEIQIGQALDAFARERAVAGQDQLILRWRNHKRTATPGNHVWAVRCGCDESAVHVCSQDEPYAQKASSATPIQLEKAICMRPLFSAALSLPDSMGESAC